MKMFGLAAIAAVAAMAFIGASSASATTTVLCKVDELVCPAASKIQNTTFTALSTNAVLLTNLSNVACTHVVLSGTALTLASSLVGHFNLIDLTGCKESVFGSKCTVITNNAGLFRILKTGPNAGTFGMEGVELLFNCPTLGLHCVYGNPTTPFNLSGSVGTALATISASGVTLPKKEGGFFCPSIAQWDATYTVTTPDPVYISE